MQHLLLHHSMRQPRLAMDEGSSAAKRPSALLRRIGIPAIELPPSLQRFPLLFKLAFVAFTVTDIVCQLIPWTWFLKFFRRGTFYLVVLSSVLWAFPIYSRLNNVVYALELDPYLAPYNSRWSGKLLRHARLILCRQVCYTVLAFLGWVLFISVNENEAGPWTLILILPSSLACLTAMCLELSMTDGDWVFWKNGEQAGGNGDGQLEDENSGPLASLYRDYRSGARADTVSLLTIEYDQSEDQGSGPLACAYRDYLAIRLPYEISQTATAHGEDHRCQDQVHITSLNYCV